MEGEVGMIQAQVEAILNHSGRQAQVKGEHSCDDLVQNLSSASAAAGTTCLLGTEAEWGVNARSFDYDEGNTRLFDYDEGNTRSFDYDEGKTRLFDYDEGRTAQVKRKRPSEDPTAVAAASGIKAQVKRKRPCEDLVENPSATAGNNLLGMIKDQVATVFNYVGRKAQVIWKRPFEHVVDNPSATEWEGRNAQVKWKRPFEDLVDNPSATEWEGRKAQEKWDPPFQGLFGNPSATAAASGNKVQVTGGKDYRYPYGTDDDGYPIHPCPETKYRLERDHFVLQIRYPPLKPMFPAYYYYDPGYLALVAAGANVKNGGKKLLRQA